MNRIWRKMVILVTLLTGLMIFSGTALAQGDDVVLIVNDEWCQFTAAQAKPKIIDDRVYVPLRVVSEALGHQVTWNKANNQILIAMKDWNGVPASRPNTTGKLEVIINDEQLIIDDALGEPFMLEGGYTMLPLRAVGNALDCEVNWSSGVAIVKEKPKAPIVPVAPPAIATNPTVSNPNYNLTIMGDSIATQAQIEKFLADKEKTIRLKMAQNYTDREFIPFPEHIAELYLELGKKYHIRGDIALAQALKETGYFQFEGSVQYFQNNYCGLGATGMALIGNEYPSGVNPEKVFCVPGMHGLSFITPAAGVEAQLQHLYAYGSHAKLPLGTELLDPRFGFVTRGISNRWIDLDGRWAVPGVGYGESILDDYWAPMLKY